jgi:hypothetical protein
MLDTKHLYYKMFLIKLSTDRSWSRSSVHFWLPGGTLLTVTALQGLLKRALLYQAVGLATYMLLGGLDGLLLLAERGGDGGQSQPAGGTRGICFLKEFAFTLNFFFSGRV